MKSLVLNNRTQFIFYKSWHHMLKTMLYFGTTLKAFSISIGELNGVYTICTIIRKLPGGVQKRLKLLAWRPGE